MAIGLMARARRTSLLVFIVIFVLAEAAAGQSAPASTTIPGGLRALALAAKMNPDTAPALFFLEYARTLIANTQGSQAQEYVAGLRRYFQSINGLKQWMTPGADGFETVVALSNMDDYNRAASIMKLLGWQVTLQQDPLVPGLYRSSVSLGVAPEDADRQAFSSAFGLDFFAVKKALETGRSFRLSIPFETVPIAFGESFWLSQVMNAKASAGGLAQALSEHLPAARLYVGLAGMSPATRQAVLQAETADRLAKRYADLLLFYGSSIAVESGRIAIPGGPQAASAWNALAGADPQNSNAFIDALLTRDSGKLLAYFSALSELSPSRQAYFAATPQRLASFYGVMPFADKELLLEHRLIRHDTRFTDLMKALPIGGDGQVQFPGGRSVWTGDFPGNGPSALAANADDQVLLGLLNAKYLVGAAPHYRSEDFLAVVRLESAWGRPIDAGSAAILSKNYGKYSTLYPYFFSLPPLTEASLRHFFGAADAIDEAVRQDRVAVNALMADFHGIVSLITILHDTGGISDSDAERIISSFCDNFAVAVRSRRAPHQSGEPTRVTLEALRGLVKSVAAESAGAQARIVEAMAGPDSPKSFEADGRTWTVRRSQWKRSRIEGVLKAQDVTPLDALLDHYDAVANAPGTSPGSDPDRNNELLNAAAPDLKNTLVGLSYAYYSAPDDLAIAEDRSFVRRHEFVPADALLIWRQTDVQNCPNRGGLCVTGGLAQLGKAAGDWGRTKADAASNLHGDPDLDPVIQALLASIRTVPWTRVTAGAMHAAAERIRSGEDLVKRAATDGPVRNELNVRLTGIVGSLRRAEIIDALTAGDGKGALDRLSSSDLYFLAVDGKAPDASAAAFGGSHSLTYGAVRPEILDLGPYEDFEMYVNPDVLWERAGHILLDIARAADREGISSEAAALLAEPVVRDLAGDLHIHNSSDWLSLIQAMNRLELTPLLPELDKMLQN